MIDLHCHVLPGIDDGPQTTEDSLAIARAAIAAGTRMMVATPHVSWEWPDNDAACIAAQVESLTGTLRDEGLDLEIRAGAEVALTRAGDLADDELRALRLGGGPYLLVECPFAQSASGFETPLFSLTARGHQIVLAHPERCAGFHRDPQALGRLVSGGMLASITAGSLAGRFGETVRKVAWDMLGQGLVHNVASDAHSELRRPPGMAAELGEAGLGEHADWLTRAVPQAIIDGEEIPPRPSVALPRPPGGDRRGGGIGRFFRRA